MVIPSQPSLGMPKDEFLAGVRRSLGRTAPSEPSGPEIPYHRLTETLPDLEAQAEVARQRIEAGRPALVDRLEATAQLRGWQVFRTLDPEEAIGYIASLAKERGATQIARSNQVALSELPLDDALENLGISTVTVARDAEHSREYLRAQIIRSDIGITGADYAVAETGSIVVVPRKGLSRLVSVVPPIHLALVRAQDVVESLDDVFLFRRLEYYQNGSDMGSYLNFITGPSRTADIEQTLVVGVHGPKEVHMVLLG